MDSQTPSYALLVRMILICRNPTFTMPIVKGSIHLVLYLNTSRPRSQHFLLRSNRHSSMLECECGNRFRKATRHSPRFCHARRPIKKTDTMALNLGVAALPPGELMPYCRILHVGGHEIKPAAIEEDLEFGTDESDLISSQKSATSLSIEPILPIFPCPRNKKRSLNDFLDLQPITSPLVDCQT